jgi:3-hydroxyisobutyrate dehydrogenase-like beta-hydroxyacid dehydrogenase
MTELGCPPTRTGVPDEDGPSGGCVATRRRTCELDGSTVSSEASATVRVQLADRGCRLVAAPVSGQRQGRQGWQAHAGLLSDADAFVEVSPLLDLLGRHVTYVGDGGHARLVKICHNLLFGVTIQNLAEITARNW